MKRTTFLLEKNYDTNTWECHKKITCEVVGEMCDGTKVWENLDEEQYFLIRKCGKYFFIHI